MIQLVYRYATEIAIAIIFSLLQGNYLTSFKPITFVFQRFKKYLALMLWTFHRVKTWTFWQWKSADPFYYHERKFDFSQTTTRTLYKSDTCLYKFIKTTCTYNSIVLRLTCALYNCKKLHFQLFLFFLLLLYWLLIHTRAIKYYLLIYIKK